MAARFYGRQPDAVVAVTGTNGKTSTVSFARQLWQQLGRRAASLGTLGVEAPGHHVAGSLTTPDPVSLHALLADLADEGVDRLALEASSHGLDQRRLDGVRLAAAAFTHLSRDHFDYHGDEASYFAAKRRLFRELLPRGAAAVLNADVPEFAQLAGRRPRARPGDRRLWPKGAPPAPRGPAHTCRRPGPGAEPRWRCAAGPSCRWSALSRPGTRWRLLGLVVAVGDDPQQAAQALERLQGAPGRMQLVGAPRPWRPVYVDYAHTPDGAGKGPGGAAAAYARPTGRRLRLRRRSRRRQATADGRGPPRGSPTSLIVTDDNPRSEDPAAIRAARPGRRHPPRSRSATGRGHPHGLRGLGRRRPAAGRRQGPRDRPDRDGDTIAAVRRCRGLRAAAHRGRRRGACDARSGRRPRSPPHRQPGAGDWAASGVTIDSRTVAPGDLFVALQRPPTTMPTRSSADALARGASAASSRGGRTASPTGTAASSSATRWRRSRISVGPGAGAARRA